MKYIFVLLVTLLAQPVVAQTKSGKISPPLVEAAPAGVGMAADRLARIDNMCREAIQNGEVPGMVALVARNGKIVYYKAFGKADNATGRNLKRDDIFRIASQTKAITSTAVMMLWEEGKFRLDDPIANYIPEFKNARVLDTVYANGSFGATAAKKEITIRHLLTHTSGIGYGVIDGDERIRKIYKDSGITDLFTTAKITIGESVRKLARLPLHHEPGEKFTYSEGLDVLAYFIEVVSGMPVDQFFKVRIFDPLGMQDTWFYLPESKHNRLVSVQQKENNTWVRYPVTFYDTDYPIKGARTFFSGGAGLSSTAKDYANFLQMYLNQGELNGTRLLSRTTVQFMMANQVGDLMGSGGTNHGLAFGLKDQKGQDVGGEGSAGTFTWGGYFNTQYFADPKEKIIGILMKQTQGPTTDNTGWKFSQLIMQAVDN